MKKENRRRKKSQEKNASLSMERANKRSTFSSMIFESGRNSLCSPRDQPADKYQTYMQYISAGRFIDGTATARPTLQPPSRRNSVTPTPRRISASIIEQGRRSVTGKENAGRVCERNGSFSKQERSPRAKSKPLFVKGNNIVKVEEGPQRTESKKREGREGREGSSRPVSAKKGKGDGRQGREGKKRAKGEDREEVEEQKMLERLFKDIQFYRDLGRGAHALVKSGVDWKTKRKIAVKIYEKGQLKTDQLRSIKRQVQILGSLDHPHIIKLYEIFESHKTINLIMEYGGGNSVDQYLRNKKKGLLEEGEAREIFREVLEGVAYMHDRGVAHRDIKPENVLLNKYLSVKIIDFGFGLKADPHPINQFCGTPTYMPPEVVSKTPHSPFLADRWSLGVLLYTMLNGHCPFKAQNQKELFVKICAGAYEFQPFVGQQAIQFIALFLKRDPQDRISAKQALLHPWMQQK